MKNSKYPNIQNSKKAKRKNFHFLNFNLLGDLEFLSFRDFDKFS